MITAIVGAIGALSSVATGIKFVSEGERAIMMRFDKAIKRRGEYKVVGPGLRLMIPGIYKLARIHVRQRTINFPEQTIILPDNTVFMVSAVVVCRVRDTAQDLYNALFETTGIKLAIIDFGLMVVRDVLGTKHYSDLFGNERQRIAEELRAKLQDQAAQWGIEIIRFELSDCSPSPETAQMVQTVAQTGFKVQALTTAADTLGYTSVLSMPGSLAAALIGVPVATAIQAGNDSGTAYEDKNN